MFSPCPQFLFALCPVVLVTRTHLCSAPELGYINFRNLHYHQRIIIHPDTELIHWHHRYRAHHASIFTQGQLSTLLVDATFALTACNVKPESSNSGLQYKGGVTQTVIHPPLIMSKYIFVLVQALSVLLSSHCCVNLSIMPGSLSRWVTEEVEFPSGR